MCVFEAFACLPRVRQRNTHTHGMGTTLKTHEKPQRDGGREGIYARTTRLIEIINVSTATKRGTKLMKNTAVYTVRPADTHTHTRVSRTHFINAQSGQCPHQTFVIIPRAHARTRSVCDRNVRPFSYFFRLHAQRWYTPIPYDRCGCLTPRRTGSCACCNTI